MSDEVKWEEFKLKYDRGKQLTLDDFDMNDVVQNIIKRMREAEREAVRQGIKNNTIVLNGNHDKCSQFYMSLRPGTISEFPPMLLGKKLMCEDFLPDKYDFALTWTQGKDINERVHELEELFRKYVKCDGQSLRFKGLSYKKNIDDFEKIKELLDD